MNTERGYYRPEEEDDEDNGAVSFGPGPAFRPVPRVPHIERLESKAKPVERAPRLPEGILFQRPKAIENTPEIDEDKTEHHENRPKNTQAIVVESELTRAARRPDTDRTNDNPMLLETQKEPVIGKSSEQTDEGEAAFRPVIYPEMPRLVTPPERSVPLPVSRQQERVIEPSEAPSTDDLRHEAQFYPSGQSEWGDTRISDLEALPSLPGAASAETLQSADTAPAEKSSEAPFPQIHGANHQTAEIPAPTANSVEEYDKNPPVVRAFAASSYGPGAGSGSGSSHGGGYPGGHGHGSGRSGGHGGGPGGTPGSGGGGGFPPSGMAGGPGSPNTNPGGQPPSSHNTYPSSGVSGGGYNMNTAPPSVTIHERPQHTTIINKKGSLLPYVAVLAERFARRRADNKLKKELHSRMDEQEQTAADNQLRLEQQQRRAAEEERRQAIRQAHRPSGNEWGVPKPYGAPESTVGAGFGAASMSGERGTSSGTVPGQVSEVRFGPAPLQPGEQQTMYAGTGVEQAGSRPDEHVEHSSWHNVVVNEKGQEVAGATQYGEAFRRERQQEIIRDHTGDSVIVGASGGDPQGGGRSSHGGGAGGGFVGGGTYNSYGSGSGGSAGSNTVTSAGSSYSNNLPNGMTTAGLPEGNPTHVDPQHQLPAHVKKAAPGPVFWLMIVLIITAFFVAAMI